MKKGLIICLLGLCVTLGLSSQINKTSVSAEGEKYTITFEGLKGTGNLEAERGVWPGEGSGTATQVSNIEGADGNCAYLNQNGEGSFSMFCHAISSSQVTEAKLGHYGISFRAKRGEQENGFNLISCDGFGVVKWIVPTTEWQDYYFVIDFQNMASTQLLFATYNSGMELYIDQVNSIYLDREVTNGQAIGTLPETPEKPGYVASWQIDEVDVNNETIYSYSENKTAKIKYSALQTGYKLCIDPGDIVSNNGDIYPHNEEVEEFKIEDGVISGKFHQIQSTIWVVNNHGLKIQKDNSYRVSFDYKTNGDEEEGDFIVWASINSKVAEDKLAGGLISYGGQYNHVEYEFTAKDSYTFRMAFQSAWLNCPNTHLYLKNIHVAEIRTYNKDDAIGELPSFASEEGYTGSWNIDGTNITKDSLFIYEEDKVATVFYSPITYTATFKADGEIIDTKDFTVETTSLNEPNVPEKDGFVGSWEAYTLTASDIVINAVYVEAITYTATFKADDVEVETVQFYSKQKSISEPQVPEKAGYTGTWEPYSLDVTEDIVINAIYSPITYTATFKADGEIIDTKDFTVETISISEPQIPSKVGYVGSWEEYEFIASDIVINAVYSPVRYTVTFKVDGEVLDTRTYTIEDKNISEPIIPTKVGYNGKWESYSLTTGDVIVNAIYEAKKCNVTFTINDEIYYFQQNVTYGSKLVESLRGGVLPSIPEVDGKIGQWELNGEKVDENTIWNVDGDGVVVCKYYDAPKAKKGCNGEVAISSTIIALCGLLATAVIKKKKTK